jgi:hypothetical protein
LISSNEFQSKQADVVLKYYAGDWLTEEMLKVFLTGTHRKYLVKDKDNYKKDEQEAEQKLVRLCKELPLLDQSQQKPSRKHTKKGDEEVDLFHLGHNWPANALAHLKDIHDTNNNLGTSTSGKDQAENKEPTEEAAVGKNAKVTPKSPFYDTALMIGFRESRLTSMPTNTSTKAKARQQENQWTAFWLPSKPKSLLNVPWMGPRRHCHSPNHPRQLQTPVLSRHSKYCHRRQKRREPPPKSVSFGAIAC